MGRIAPGDVVIVMRWPHPHVPARCVPGSVSVVHSLQHKAKCPVCGQAWQEPAAVLGYGGAVPVAWLTKLPTADELARIYTSDETSPAEASERVCGGVRWAGST